MRIVRGRAEALRTILRRQPLDEAEIPEHLRERDRRLFGPGLSLEQTVRQIVHAVRDEGDAAVARFNQSLDGSAPAPIRVTEAEVQAAHGSLQPELIDALRLAADRIRAYHERQMERSVGDFQHGGLGQIVRPLQRAGVYLPGTTIVYPSSLLMTAIPARVAGVEQVYVVSPAAVDGSVPVLKLVAADIAGVDGVFRAGGAQGIAALAYGTETIPRVDKICGPGNIFVTLAKREVFGVTGIDALYGPTETMVLADESADPALCAADLLAQAEHDEIASPILITTSEAMAKRVAAEVDRQVATLERGYVALAAFANRGGAVVVNSLDEAFELANEYAPEHLCLLLQDAWQHTGKVRNAGGVFVGESSPEALGDYIAGPSHVMPTGGSARYASPLSVNDFLKITSLIAVDESVLQDLGAAAALIARAEGLTAHARALEIRLEGR
ncbi:MAG: histidinol dehydrogenase [Dehalococcoidia bacterium]